MGVRGGLPESIHALPIGCYSLNMPIGGGGKIAAVCHSEHAPARATDGEIGARCRPVTGLQRPNLRTFWLPALDTRWCRNAGGRTAA
jgi:hypothetical protein